MTRQTDNGKDKADVSREFILVNSTAQNFGKTESELLVRLEERIENAAISKAQTK